MEQKKGKNHFSPEDTYQSGLTKLSEASQLQEFLSFYARYADTMHMENIILLWEQKSVPPEEYHTMEEWNAQDRKVIYGETSHMRLYAPEGYSGKTVEYDGHAMVALFHEKQTVQSKFHRNSAEHPFPSLTVRNILKPTNEMLLQSCVNTAISCMQTMHCGMPIFEEPGAYVTLDDPVRYDPGSNRLYIAKGASYDDAAYGLLRETLSCKQYQPNQTYQVYEMHRLQSSCTAQVILHQMGVTKSFSISMPSNTVSAQEMEHCISSIPSGIQVMRQDFAWIQRRLQEEQANQANDFPKKSVSAYQEMDQKSTGQLENAGVGAYEERKTPEFSEKKPADPLQKGSQPSLRSWDEALDFQDLSTVSASNSRHADTPVL